MSGLTLSAAVASLKPGLSTPPEIALNNWTVIKGVSDTLFPLIKTNHVLAAITTVLIVTSLFATLIRARLPTIQTQQRQLTNRSLVVDTIQPASSAFALIGLTCLSVYSDTMFHLLRLDFQELSEAVDILKPGMAIPYDTALINWNVIKLSAETIPECLPLLQSCYMWMGIAAAIVTIVSVQLIRSQLQKAQPEQYSIAKLWLDRITVGSLGLATVVSLCSYAYARTYYPKLA